MIPVVPVSGATADKAEARPVKRDMRRVAEHWSKFDCSQSERNFYMFPPIRARSCRLIFGEDDCGRKDWCEYWTIEKYLKHRVPFDKCLSICCGFGENERILARLNLAREIVGTDIAPGAIEEAKRMAGAENLTGLSYYVADLNDATLPEAEYDIVWANGALHHIADLERVIPLLRKALRPDGFFVSNEYVGANHRQVGLRQQEIINAAKHLLPRDLRADGQVGNLSLVERVMTQIAGKRWRWGREEPYELLWKPPSLRSVMETDPSEGVCAERIIPLLREHFHDVEVRGFGGSILMHALDQTFYARFDPGDRDHRKLLQCLFLLEDALISAGEIPDDNAHIICRTEA